MKPSRWWKRIVILLLLALSVLAPLLLFSSRLKSLTSNGWNEVVEDLNRFEAKKGLRKLPRDVYKYETSNSVVFFNFSNPIIGLQGPISVEARVDLVGGNGTIEGIREKQESISSYVGKEKVNQKTVHSGHGQLLQYQAPRTVDDTVMKMKDQLIRAKVYLQFSPPNSSSRFAKELRQRIRDLEQALGDATKDSELSRSARQKMRSMQSSLIKGSRIYIDCVKINSKLQAMAYSSEERIRRQKNQMVHQIQVAAMAIPKGLHCLSMQLTTEYFTLEPEKRNLPNSHKIVDPDLYHFAVFSDNVLACAVVVNSTVSRTKEAVNVVFHVVTDSLNLPAISMWFLLNPPGESTVQIQSTDSFKTLLSDQNSKSMNRSHNQPTLDHIRLNLPRIFPALNKIVVLDHDVVVQKDLTALWGVNMKGKVVGAAETCPEGESSQLEMSVLIKFLNQVTESGLDQNSCTWGFGMNVFDLQAWRRNNFTALFNKLSHMVHSLKKVSRLFSSWNNKARQGHDLAEIGCLKRVRVSEIGEPIVDLGGIL